MGSPTHGELIARGYAKLAFETHPTDADAAEAFIAYHIPDKDSDPSPTWASSTRGLARIYYAKMVEGTYVDG